MRSESDGLKSCHGSARTQGFFPKGNGRRRPIPCFPDIRKGARLSSPRVANPQVKEMIGVSDPTHPSRSPGCLADALSLRPDHGTADDDADIAQQRNLLSSRQQSLSTRSATGRSAFPPETGDIV